jgi:phosphatidylglycerophosphate synthase
MAQREEHAEGGPAALVIPSDAAFFQTTVCGTSIMLRTVCSLGRVTDTVHVLKTPAYSETHAKDVESEIDGRELKPRLAWAAAPESIPTDNGLFVVSAPGVFDYRLCSAMESEGKESNRIIRCRRPGQERAALWFVGPESARQLVRHLADNPRAGSSLDFLSGQSVQDFNPDATICEVISDERSRQLAERKLLRGARKDSDTFIAKHFDRRISGWLTRWAVRVPVTPNQLTVMSTALGLGGAALLLLGSYGAQLAGATLLVLSIIFDGCDGEVARLKFMESNFGRKLDFFLDNVVNASAIFATGGGYYLRYGDSFYLYASLIGTALAVAAVLPVYFLFFRGNKAAADPSREKSRDAYSLTEDIAGRDFIYLIFALALIGKVHWFAILCVGGMSMFLPAVFVLLAVRHWRRMERI